MSNTTYVLRTRAFTGDWDELDELDGSEYTEAGARLLADEYALAFRIDPSEVKVTTVPGVAK